MVGAQRARRAVSLLPLLLPSEATRSASTGPTRATFQLLFFLARPLDQRPVQPVAHGRYPGREQAESGPHQHVVALRQPVDAQQKPAGQKAFADESNHARLALMRALYRNGGGIDKEGQETWRHRLRSGRSGVESLSARAA